MAKRLPYTNPDYVFEISGDTVTLVQCDAASAIIDQHLSSIATSMYGAAGVTQSYSGMNKKWLDLGVYPIANVTSVSIDSVILDPSTYQTPAQHGMADGYLYREDYWTLGIGNISATFDVAPRSDVMEIVRLVASMIATTLKKSLTVGNVYLETIGTYTIQYQRNVNMKSQIEQYLDLLPSNENITSVDGMDLTTDIRSRLEQSSDTNSSWTF